MSIIERAAELLRSNPPSLLSRAATSEKDKLPRPDLIERAAAAADLPDRSYMPAYREPPLGPGKRNASGQSSVSATRQFAVDRDRLRALGLITPDDQRTPLAESFRRIKRQILAK